MAHILVLDAQDGVREATCRLLDGAGHSAAAAATQAAALRLVGARRFDALVLDVALLGSDGRTFVNRLRSSGLGPYAPVLASAHTTDPDARVEVLHRGADDVLLKPFDGRELLARLALLLDAAAHRRTGRHDGAEQSDARDELLGLMVHDLKSPLTVIIGNLELVAEELGRLEVTESVVEAVADAADAATALHRMVGNMLDVGRAEAGQMPLYVGPVRVDEVTEAVARGRVREARMQGIRFEVAPSGVELDADLWVLRRMIDNLVDNALRHTPPGGRIRLRAEALADVVRIEVANTGAPIPVELRERLFDKYMQLRRTQGPRHNSGMGLYFCRLAAAAHGGRVGIEQTEEFATVFVIELPGRQSLE